MTARFGRRLYRTIGFDAPSKIGEAMAGVADRSAS